MSLAPSEGMRRAAGLLRGRVLDSERRRLEHNNLYELLRAADIVVPNDLGGFSEAYVQSLCAETEAFQTALEEAGVRSVPLLNGSLDHALEVGHALDVTLKLTDGQFEAAGEDLREITMALTAWSPEELPGWVFGQDREQAGIADAAEKLCLICVPRERLTEEQRARTFEVLHLLAPQLSPGRLDSLERCLRQVESDGDSDEVLRPGLTGSDRIGVVPVWPDPERRRQRWAVAADRSWVFAAPVDGATGGDADRVVKRMGPRWERAPLPDNGAALASVLVEVAIQSAARRAQTLGRAAEGAFPLEDEDEIRVALDGLASDLAELNAGVDELELAAADARADLERALDSLPDDSDSEELYESLRESLDESLDKLDRQQQRLQGSFLAAREHAASSHVAGTVEALKRNQETIAEAQGSTEELNRAVSRLTIMLLGPTIAFGALGVTDYWFPHGEYVVSVAALFAYVLVGFVISWLICRNINFFTELFTPPLQSSDEPTSPACGDRTS